MQTYHYGTTNGERARVSLMRLRVLSNGLVAHKKELEQVVLEIPTGNTRNMVADANIHLGACIDLIEKLELQLRK